MKIETDRLSGDFLFGLGVAGWTIDFCGEMFRVLAIGVDRHHLIVEPL